MSTEPPAGSAAPIDGGLGGSTGAEAGPTGGGGGVPTVGTARFLDRLIGELHPEDAAQASWFALHEPLRFWDGAQVWTVPAGFHSDLASIPWWARWIATWNAWRPGVLHDWLVRTGIVNRLEADALFATALEAEDLAFWRQVLMYAAVRAHAAWRWSTRWTR